MTKEIIDFNNLEKYNINQELLSVADSGLSEADTLSYLKAEGHVPPGKWGEAETVKTIRETAGFKDGLEEYLEGKRQTLYTENIDNVHEDFVLSLEFSDLYEKGQVFYRLGRERSVDLIKAWIYHVALCITDYPEERTTYLITWDKKKATHKKVKFGALEPDYALSIMKEILQFYDSGTKKPLAFFPESSLAYIEKFRKKGDSAQAYSAALKKWEPDEYNPGKRESEDYYFSACFGEELPGSEDIEEPASLFYEPLLKAKKEVKE